MPKYIYPTTRHDVSDDFAAHLARHSVNPGVDFKTWFYPPGSSSYLAPIFAVADGRVTAIQKGSNGLQGRIGYVEYIDIYGALHQDLHIDSAHVIVGQNITQGQTIATAGMTGTDGPHDHHTMRLKGINVDFLLYVTAAAVAAVLSSRVTTTTTTTEKNGHTDMFVGFVHSTDNTRLQNYLFVPGYKPEPLNQAETNEMCKGTGQDPADLPSYEETQRDWIGGVLTRLQKA